MQRDAKKSTNLKFQIIVFL